VTQSVRVDAPLPRSTVRTIFGQSEYDTARQSPGKHVHIDFRMPVTAPWLPLRPQYGRISHAPRFNAYSAQTRLARLGAAPSAAAMRINVSGAEGS